MTTRLRFGLLCDGSVLSAWQRSVLQDLAAGDDADLAVVVLNRADGPPSRTGGLERLRAPTAMWDLYNNVWVARRSAAVRPVDCSDLWDGVEQMSVTPEPVGRYRRRFPRSDVERLAGLELDFLLRFGFGILTGDILQVAAHGVWSFHHDDEREIRGGPPSFWEVYDGLPTTGVLLQRLTEELDAGVPLLRWIFQTVPHSYPRNRDRVSLGSTSMPALAARAVRLGHLDTRTLDAATSAAPVRRDPPNVTMARFAARQVVRTLRRQFRDTLTVDVWGIGLTHGSALSSLLDGRCRVDWLPELASGGYLADPCEVPVHTGRTVLVEEFDQATDRGVVSALRSEGSGWRLVSGVIDPGVHASYPLVVEDDGTLCCTAETWQADEVALWRCADPGTGLRWERVATLVEHVPLVDPTVFLLDGTWWLLATRRDAEPDAALHAWTAPDLTGPWRPHPLNPLKVDAASSRPAGRPFWDGDRLVRPAQDCSTGYGAGVVLNEVTRLDESGLVESVVGRLSLPRSRYSRGSHTLSASADGWVVDGRRTGVSRHRAGRELGARWRAVRRRIG